MFLVMSENIDGFHLEQLPCRETAVVCRDLHTFGAKIFHLLECATHSETLKSNSHMLIQSQLETQKTDGILTRQISVSHK